MKLDLQVSFLRLKHDLRLQGHLDEIESKLLKIKRINRVLFKRLLTAQPLRSNPEIRTFMAREILARMLEMTTSSSFRHTQEHQIDASETSGKMDPDAFGLSNRSAYETAKSLEGAVMWGVSYGFDRQFVFLHRPCRFPCRRPPLLAKPVVGDMVHVSDLFTTLARLGGAKGNIPTDRIIDGIDQTSLLLNAEEHGRRDYVFLYNTNKLEAVVKEQYKLAIPGGSIENAILADFYDLFRDPQEK